MNDNDDRIRKGILMKETTYLEKAKTYIHFLSSVRPNRRTGSVGNQEAADYAADILTKLGYTVDTKPFPALDYTSSSPSLTYNGEPFKVHPSPYTLGCAIQAELVCASTLEELDQLECTGKLLLMTGELCTEPLMPKNFPFYNPENHKLIYALLEKKQPAAIITATQKSPGLAGALDPPPLFCDGDFDIPSIYCPLAVGKQLIALAGETLELSINASRYPSFANNVLVNTSTASKRVLVTAHIDAYEDAPGALDNAAGATVILLLADMVKADAIKDTIEFALFNGEDHYSAAGQIDYLRRYEETLEKVNFVINIDGVGYVQGETAFSSYGFDHAQLERIQATLGRSPGLIEGPPWYSGDHMIFVQKGIPALAFTSEHMEELSRSITHTAKDIPEIVNPSKLVELAEILLELIKNI